MAETYRKIERTDPAFPKACAILRELRTFLDAATIATKLEEQEKGWGYELHGAFRGDELLGVAGFRTVQTLVRGRHMHLDDLVVTEAHQAEGIGKGLMAYLEALAKERGLTALFLDARAEAISFYERRGYEPHVAPLYRKRFVKVS